MISFKNTKHFNLAVTTKRLGTENNHFNNSRCQTSLLINDLQYTIVSQIQLRLTRIFVHLNYGLKNINQIKNKLRVEQKYLYYQNTENEENH